MLDNFFCFSRGEFLVATTNKKDTVQVDVPNVPFDNGTVVCNAFNDQDCQTVEAGKVSVTLMGGESKIYVP